MKFIKIGQQHVNAALITNFYFREAVAAQPFEERENDYGVGYSDIGAEGSPEYLVIQFFGQHSISFEGEEAIEGYKNLSKLN